jgi:hypothetical protein
VVADACIDTDQLGALEQTGFWLLNRVWPRTIPELEEAFLNFRLIEQDLTAVVGWYSSERHGLTLIDRAYKEMWSGDRQNRLFLERRSEYNRDLAADLAVELTRAVNRVCERVRQHVLPDYRLAEGHATIGLGMDQFLSYQVLRPLYPVDAPPRPYPGLEPFLEQRTKRDWYRGAGRPPEGAGLPGVSL